MTPYSQLITQIVPGVTLTLREYTIRRNTRRLTLAIENSLVHDIIPANVPLSRDQLEQYYGEQLSEMDYLQLSSVNCFRVVLLTQVDEHNNPVYKPVFINQDYYESGLQEVEIISGAFTDVPVYAPQMMGQHIRTPIKMEAIDYGETSSYFPPR